MTELVAEAGSLPSLAAQIVSLTADPQCDLGRLARLIRSDSVLTMRFLALANSAAFAQGSEIRELRTALVRLGTRRVRNVALLMGMHDMTPPRSAGQPLDTTAYWKHCLAVAGCAQGLARVSGRACPEDAWLVGILHGLGVTVLAQREPTAFAAAVDLARRQGTTLVAAELRVLDYHHGELAGRILRAWQLPGLFADVVEFHPESFAADEVAPEAAALITLLRDAIAIARAVGFGDSGDRDRCPEVPDLAADLALAAPALEALAAEVDGEVHEMAALVGLEFAANLFSEALATSQQAVARVGLEGFDDTLTREELEGELAAARRIQQQILPQRLPDLPGFVLAAINVPSRSVSGDTYDFITLRDGCPVLMIADVSGKGTPAALLASTLQASIRALAQVCDDPGELLVAANRAMFDSTDPERFATVFLAAVDPDGAGIRYAGGGHDPVLLRRADGVIQWLRPAGMGLGMLPQATFPVAHVPLAPGDLLVAYTDGITEAGDQRRKAFGTGGLAAVVTGAGPLAPGDLIDRVVAAVGRHVTGSADAPPRGLDDDLTMIVLQKT